MSDMRRRKFIALLGGGVAARGARAAGGQAADHRVPWRGHAEGGEPTGCRFHAAVAIQSDGEVNH
jgi:hypothetical protein